jgi:hypothetical protein
MQQITRISSDMRLKPMDYGNADVRYPTESRENLGAKCYIVAVYIVEKGFSCFQDCIRILQGM